MTKAALNWSEFLPGCAELVGVLRQHSRHDRPGSSETRMETSAAAQCAEMVGVLKTRAEMVTASALK